MSWLLEMLRSAGEEKSLLAVVVVVGAVVLFQANVDSRQNEIQQSQKESLDSLFDTLYRISETQQKTTADLAETNKHLTQTATILRELDERGPRALKEHEREFDHRRR